MIGNYKKVRKLGDGATGEVWLCTKGKLNYAVKVVDPVLMKTDGDFVLTMFGNEVELSDKLKHPHIVETIESQISDDSVYSVLEYADGGNIEQFCNQESLIHIDTLIEYARQISKAMGFASSAFSLVHCDIKPSNILLFGDIVKVSDFGASIRQSQHSKIDVKAGSPSYMSPEQIQGGDLTAATDIYSFGVVLYQLATGRLPFFASTAEDAFHQTLNAEVPRPSLFRVEIHRDLEALILKCMQKRPQSRFSSWADVGMALARVAQEIAKAHIPWVDRRPIFESLKTQPFFESFHDRQIWEILQASKVISVGDGQRVVHRNERSQTLYFLVDGSLSVEIGGKVVCILKPGEVFGEIPYLTGSKDSVRTANVDAIQPCTLMIVNPQAIDLMGVDSRLSIMTAFCRAIALRLQAQMGLCYE